MNEYRSNDINKIASLMPPAWCHLPGAIYMYLVHVYLVPRIPGATYLVPLTLGRIMIIHCIFP